MTRHEIETVQIGQTGLYCWDKSLPVCWIGEMHTVLVGRDEGKAFRYIQVQSETAKIGFTISEGDQ